MDCGTQDKVLLACSTAFDTFLSLLTGSQATSIKGILMHENFVFLYQMKSQALKSLENELVSVSAP